MNIAALILFLVFSLVPSQSRFAIFGHVRDANGNGVGSIRVSLLNENEQTLSTVFADNSGRFQFRNLSEGTYLVRVEPAGTPFEEQTQRIELQSASRLASSTEDPWMVDFSLKLRKGETGTAAPGVVFLQPVPPEAREQYGKGVVSLNDKKTEMGIQSLQKAIEIFPDYFLALELLGTEYVKGGLYDNAVPILSRAIQVNPDASKCLYALGVAHLKTNRSAEAVNWLQRAADKDPKSANVYMMLGLSYGNLGSLSESETAFKKAYLLGRSNVADVHYYLAGIYNKQQKYSEAARELELFLKEAKDIKDPAQIKGMIAKFKEKAQTAKE
jgi:tetratricopeptide (TPR) repeat protein